MNTKTWCRHIKYAKVSRWHKPSGSHYWGQHWAICYNSISRPIVEVPHTWKFCPICQTPRPVKNI
jgi:hypothetical protein